MNDLLRIKDRYVELTRGYLDYHKFNNYHITHHSTVIEGSTLSYKELIMLLDSGITPSSGKPFNHLLMARDHLEALRFTLNIAEKKEKLTVEIIQKISALLLKNTGAYYNTITGSFDSSKGEFRKTGVHVGSRSFSKFKEIPGLINNLVDEINSTIDDCKDFSSCNNLAFDSHFQMVSIHPFIDGNGRLSRLIMNYVQHYHGHPITTVLSENKALYFEALEETREQQNPEIFRKFMFKEALKFFKDEIQIMTQSQEYKKAKGEGLSFLF